MYNGDMPINGINTSLVDDADTAKEVELAVQLSGLTKREHFAGLAMQALITTGLEKRWTNKEQATIAINMADALLKELEK